MSSTPNAVEQALVAFQRNDATRQQQIDSAVELNEWGIFSVQHIIQITGLPHNFAYDLLQKSSMTGGRFNPEALPEIYELMMHWRQGGRDEKLACRVIEMGVSANFLQKLTGIPSSTVSRWAAKGKKLK